MIRNAALLLALTPLFAQTQRPVLSVCDVIREPQRYDGRLIAVRGNLSRGQEGFTFFDPRCRGEISWMHPGTSPIRDSWNETEVVSEIMRRAKRTDLVEITVTGTFRVVAKPGPWDSPLQLTVTNVSLESMVVTPR